MTQAKRRIPVEVAARAVHHELERTLRLMLDITDAVPRSRERVRLDKAVDKVIEARSEVDDLLRGFQT